MLNLTSVCEGKSLTRMFRIDNASYVCIYMAGTRIPNKATFAIYVQNSWRHTRKFTSFYDR